MFIERISSRDNEHQAPSPNIASGAEPDRLYIIPDLLTYLVSPRSLKVTSKPGRNVATIINGACDAADIARLPPDTYQPPTATVELRYPLRDAVSPPSHPERENTPGWLASLTVPCSKQRHPDEHHYLAFRLVYHCN